LLILIRNDKVVLICTI